MTSTNPIRTAIVLLLCVGCGGSKPAWNPESVPLEYRLFLPEGKIVPTGNATLDYWVHVNVSLHTLQWSQTDESLLPMLQAVAKFIRGKSAAGVDAEVVTWALGVADSMEKQAVILTRLNDPATLREAKEQVAAGKPNPLDTLERWSVEWEQERNRLSNEAKQLQATLSRHHARQFPPPQW